MAARILLNYVRSVKTIILQVNAALVKI